MSCTQQANEQVILKQAKLLKLETAGNLAAMAFFSINVLSLVKNETALRLILCRINHTDNENESNSGKYFESS